MSEQRQRRRVIQFCFYRKVERVYKVALRARTKQIANVKAKLHTEQIIKLETNILNRAQRFIKNNIQLLARKKIAIRYDFNFAFSDRRMHAMKTTS